MKHTICPVETKKNGKKCGECHKKDCSGFIGKAAQGDLKIDLNEKRRDEMTLLVSRIHA